MESVNNSGQFLRINLEGIFAQLDEQLEKNIIKREPVPYDVTDMKRLLMRIGQTRCGSERFTIDEDNKFAYENIFKWCIGDESMLAVNPFSGNIEKGSLTKGLYIAGPTGTGKTMCLNIFRDFLDKVGVMVTIPGYGRAQLAWRTFFAQDLFQNCVEYGDVRWVQDYPSICIQDAGSEVREAVRMGTRYDTIGQILQRRGETRYMTFLTSNDKISENRYGERVASRLCKMCNYYEIKGKDRRK